ncbi:CFEM domain-containing protein [Colletotrichum truncatum]|uniref:CFEM domain-containing protein n=1 Tax=Colletotrichum truncatum TaxID=5467 RepID=A0ACC3YEA7_COLTU|nr:CFEM domain-containing protein [Colletotrichum truncatum]KAF6790154.1 CFEM domain-containing protein [Colletotrichum truncatum]
MHFSQMLVAFATALMISNVTAQSTPTAAEALAKAKKLYPECALVCLTKLVPTSGCKLTDTTCLCTNVELNAGLSTCVQQGCNFEDALKTKNGSATMCGLPVRDERLKPPLVAGVGFGLAFIVYVLRLCSAMPGSGRELSWDDWTITACVILTIPPTVFAFTLSDNGLGKDIWTLPLKNIENVLFYYFLGELFYFAAQTMNKISILLFLHRVFSHNNVGKGIWVTIGLCLAYAVAFIFATLFQCWPINHAWLQLEEDHLGRCNNIHLQGWLSAAFNIVLDLIILILPLHQLYLLQMPLKKKLMVMGVISMGVFVTIASIIRLHTLVTFASSQNITYDYVDAAYWSTIELYAGIITASLPAVYKLFSTIRSKAPSLSTAKAKLVGGSSSYGSSKSGGTTVSGSSTIAHRLSGKRSEAEFILLTDVESAKGQRWT